MDLDDGIFLRALCSYLFVALTSMALLKPGISNARSAKGIM
jgi:hypothetical protein